MNRRLLITERFETRMQDPSERGISKNKRDPASATDALQAALAERAQFLRERPHLQAYQNEIDRLLDKSGNHQGRLAVLSALMQAKLLEMQRNLCALNKIIQTSLS